MRAVIIIVMCIVAVGISFSRISALRARNRAERDGVQKGATLSAPEAASDPASAPETDNKIGSRATFADYLDAENAPTLTRAQMDEWRRDFALACKYGRRPCKGKAPFMRYLRETGFSLPYKSAMPTARAAKRNEKALPPCSPQKSLASCYKASYKAYIKSNEPSPVMR